MSNAMPELSQEQRSEALEKAWEARSVRAELREQIKNEELLPSDVLNLINDPVIAKMKVSAMISALPGYGKLKTERIMEQMGISKNRRLGGLGKRQRDAIIERLG